MLKLLFVMMRRNKLQIEAFIHAYSLDSYKVDVFF